MVLGFEDVCPHSGWEIHSAHCYLADGPRSSYSPKSNHQTLGTLSEAHVSCPDRCPGSWHHTSAAQGHLLSCVLSAVR